MVRRQPYVSFLTRLRYGAIIILVRCMTDFSFFALRVFNIRIGQSLLGLPRSIAPTRTTSIQSSKDANRHIKLHIYEPPGYAPADGPLPVHVSFQGCGFVGHTHGLDADKCARLAATLRCAVIDADYAKAPEHPHPACIDDALDVLAYVRAQPVRFDAARVSVGGFSSGAYIAIMAALRLPKDVVKAVVAWYPITNFAVSEEERERRLPPRPPLPAGSPGIHLHRWQRNLFFNSYLTPGLDLTDPLVSPIFADSSAFPPITFITGEYDVLFGDSADLAERLIKDGVDCEFVKIPNAAHNFEGLVKEGTPQWEALEQALVLVRKRLRAAFDMDSQRD